MTIIDSKSSPTKRYQALSLGTNANSFRKQAGFIDPRVIYVSSLSVKMSSVM